MAVACCSCREGGKRYPGGKSCKFRENPLLCVCCMCLVECVYGRNHGWNEPVARTCVYVCGGGGGELGLAIECKHQLLSQSDSHTAALPLRG
jgi:hypothetical protein